MLFWQQNSKETLAHMGVHTHVYTHRPTFCSLYERSASQREKHKSNIGVLVFQAYTANTQVGIIIQWVQEKNISLACPTYSKRLKDGQMKQ